MSQTWTDADTEQLLGLLERLPEYKPSPIFLWFCRHVVGSPLEGIFYRMNAGHNEVLLKRRPNDQMKDPYYAGKLDVFGTVMLPSDALPQEDPEWETNPYREPLKRILADAGLTKFNGQPRIIPGRLFLGDRGPVNQTVALCKVPEDETPQGQWYSLDNLPEDLIWEHRSLILHAARHFLY